MHHTMFFKWLRVSLELIASVVIMATGTVLWLYMAVPDPVSMLIGFVGLSLWFIEVDDMDRCEKIARKKEEQSARIIKTRKDVPNVPSIANLKRL